MNFLRSAIAVLVFVVSAAQVMAVDPTVTAGAATSAVLQGDGSPVIGLDGNPVVIPGSTGTIVTLTFSGINVSNVSSVSTPYIFDWGDGEVSIINDPTKVMEGQKLQHVYRRGSSSGESTIAVYNGDKQAVSVAGVTPVSFAGTNAAAATMQFTLVDNCSPLKTAKNVSIGATYTGATAPSSLTTKFSELNPWVILDLNDMPVTEGTVTEPVATATNGKGIRFYYTEGNKAFNKSKEQLESNYFYVNDTSTPTTDNRTLVAVNSVSDAPENTAVYAVSVNCDRNSGRISVRITLVDQNGAQSPWENIRALSMFFRTGWTSGQTPENFVYNDFSVDYYPIAKAYQAMNTRNYNVEAQYAAFRFSVIEVDPLTSENQISYLQNPYYMFRNNENSHSESPAVISYIPTGATTTFGVYPDAFDKDVGGNAIVGVYTDDGSSVAAGSVRSNNYEAMKVVQVDPTGMLTEEVSGSAGAAIKDKVLSAFLIGLGDNDPSAMDDMRYTVDVGGICMDIAAGSVWQGVNYEALNAYYLAEMTTGPGTGDKSTLKNVIILFTARGMYVLKSGATGTDQEIPSDAGYAVMRVYADPDCEFNHISHSGSEDGLEGYDSFSEAIANIDNYEYGTYYYDSANGCYVILARKFFGVELEGGKVSQVSASVRETVMANGDSDAKSGAGIYDIAGQANGCVCTNESASVSIEAPMQDINSAYGADGRTVRMIVNADGSFYVESFNTTTGALLSNARSDGLTSSFTFKVDAGGYVGAYRYDAGNANYTAITELNVANKAAFDADATTPAWWYDSTNQVYYIRADKFSGYSPGSAGSSDDSSSSSGCQMASSGSPVALLPLIAVLALILLGVLLTRKKA